MPLALACQTKNRDRRLKSDDQATVKRQQFFRHRLQTLSALHEAVAAMRSLSAHHFRCARQALPAARNYRDEMNSLVAEIGIRQSRSDSAPTGLLIFASDLGLCGDFNSKLSQLAIGEVEQLQVKTIYSVGRRARRALTSHSLTPQRNYDAPASLEGVSDVLLALAQDVFEDYLEHRIGSLYVIYAAFEGVGKFTPQSARVLPIDPIASVSTSRRSPYVARDHLMTVAVREFLYITLYELLLDSLASEHGMRLMAAESAIDWLENTSARTSRQLATSRSEASTQELLDIVSGSRSKFRNVAQ
jgi:F-type H+-transporting ATPase subunit gamma